MTLQLFYEFIDQLEDLIYQQSNQLETERLDRKTDRTQKEYLRGMSEGLISSLGVIEKLRRQTNLNTKELSDFIEDVERFISKRSSKLPSTSTLQESDTLKKEYLQGFKEGLHRSLQLINHLKLTLHFSKELIQTH